MFVVVGDFGSGPTLKFNLTGNSQVCGYRVRFFGQQNSPPQPDDIGPHVTWSLPINIQAFGVIIFGLRGLNRMPIILYIWRRYLYSYPILNLICG